MQSQLEILMGVSNGRFAAVTPKIGATEVFGARCGVRLEQDPLLTI